MDRRKFNRGVPNKGNLGNTLKNRIWHKEKWEEDIEVSELEEKIRSGVYAPRDVYLLKVLKADRVILKNMADKVLATLHDIRGVDGEPLMALPDEDRQLITAALKYASTRKTKSKDSDE